MQLLRGEPGTIVGLEVLSEPANESRILEIQRDPTAAWLWSVIQAADHDPWRRKVRDACDLEDVTLRVAELEKLVEEVDRLDQPVRFLNQLAAELARANAIDRATTLLEQVWQEHPGDVSTNLSLAICLRRKKPAQIEEGLRYYTAVIAIRHESALLRNMRGVVFWSLGKTDEAFADYCEAVRLDPNFAAAHTNLGTALAHQGKVEEALAEHREAIRLKPDDAIAHLGLGTALAQQGKLDDGINEYREAIRLNPSNADTHYNLGNALTSQRKFDESIAEYREAIRLKPKFPGALTNLGQILAKQGNLEEAIVLYREALRITPFGEAYNAHNSLGNALRMQGKLDEAINEYREAIRLTTNDAGAINDLAWLLAASPDPKKREPAQAVELAMKAVQLAPANGGYLNTLGVAQYRSGRWKAAIEVLEKANKLSDNLFSDNGFFLAMSNWQLDEKSEARTWYDQSVDWMDKNKPNDQELLHFRVEAAELLGVKDELKSKRID